MTSQGTARGRFQRAIRRRHVGAAEMATKEMGQLRPRSTARACRVPRTHRQPDDPLIGARARTRIVGVAEVRTLEGGEVRQYLVWPDGTATLVESRPASLLYGRLDAARQFAGWLAAAGRVADRLSGNGNPSEEATSHWLALAPVLRRTPLVDR
jgi:hypothetical protein